MPLQVRRGTNSQRTALSGVKIPAAGELLFTTDTKLLYVGDGTTAGGVPIGNGNLPANTGNLAEGSNLYYTDARARSAISLTDAGGDGAMTYNSSTGVFTYNGPSASEVRSKISVSGRLSYDSTTGHISYPGPSNDEVTSKISSGDSSISYSSGVIKLNPDITLRNDGTIRRITQESVLQVDHEINIRSNTLNEYISLGLPKNISDQISQVSLCSINVGKPRYYSSNNLNSRIIYDRLASIYPLNPAVSGSQYSTDGYAQAIGQRYPLFYYNSIQNSIEVNPITISNVNKFTILMVNSSWTAGNNSGEIQLNSLIKSKEGLLLILKTPTPYNDYHFPVPRYGSDHQSLDPILVYKVTDVDQTSTVSISGQSFRKIILSVTLMYSSNVSNINSTFESFLKNYRFDTSSEDPLSSGLQLSLVAESNLGVSVEGPLRLDSINNMSGKIVFPDNTVQTTAYQVVTAPTTATSSGITGQIAYDSNYVYICTATNTWKRSALSSW